MAPAIADGLGPTFNEAACGNCHTTPVTGGSGTQVERRFGQITNGVFFAFDRDPNNFGGTLRQLFSNGTSANGTASCTVPFDAEAPTANIHNVGRRTVPLFGLGLIDAMPDSWFDGLAASEPTATRGTVLRSIPNFPDSRDSNQSLTRTRVRRFGLKDQQTNLVSFSGDAYNNEMGVTTQSCYKGTSIIAFALENLPSGVALPVACNGGDLKPANPAGNPDIPQFTDGVVGSCAGGLDEVQDDMANFLFFMEHLAPPSQVTSDPQAITTGGALFQSTGCASCHSPVAFTTPAAPFNGVPGSMQFFPFSDFLVHDMGTLGDGIGETGDSLATTRQMQRRRCGARGSTRSSSTMAARRPCSTRSSRRRPGARGAHQLQQARFHEPVADRPVRQHAVASRTWALRCSPAGGPLGLPGRRARRGQLGTRDRLLATPADPRERHRWPKLRPNYV